MNKLGNSIDHHKDFSLGRILLVLIFCFGICTRIGIYLANRSIWLDEASLASSVINKSFYELTTEPLDYGQAAPIGFVLLTKIIVLVFGKNEYALRSIPFISGILSLFLFYQVIIRCLPKKYVALPLFLFAASSELMRYATEFKPYSSDVLCALSLLLFILIALGNEYTCRTGIMFGAIGAVTLWFSFPSLFVLAGGGLVLFLSSVLEKKRENIKNLVISFICWGISFIPLYFLFLKEIGGRTLLQNYWKNSFIPMPPCTVREILFFSGAFVKIFYMMNQTIIGLYMFLVGAYATFRKQKKIFFILLSPLLLTLIASSFRKYPFESRLILFYFPFLYLFITEGVIFFTDARSFYPKILGFILIVLIVCPALIVSYIELFHGVFYPDEIKPILNYVRMNRQKEDTIYVYYGAERAFQYYADTYGFENGSYIIGKNFKENWEQYRTDIDQLKGKTRVWIIFTHVYFDQERSEEKYIVDYMESIGKRLDSFHAVRASVYLYDFTNSPQI